MEPLRHPALIRRLLRQGLEALMGRVRAMPFKRVGPRKVVATVVTEVDYKGVPLRSIAMTLELLKVLEVLVRADTALDRSDCPTREVGF